MMMFLCCMQNLCIPNAMLSSFACLERAAMILGYYHWHTLLRWRRPS